MKNLNLIKRLWTDSHEKQKPQRFVRYAVMLIMLLTLGVGQMWANGGIGYKGVKFTKNGSATGWYNIHNVSWDYSNASYECRSGKTGVTDFNNASLGTVTTLKLKAFVVIGWTDNSDYVAGQLKYRLYKQGASAPSYSTYNVGNYGSSSNSSSAANVLASKDNNRVVGNASLTTDIVTASTAPGNYYLQLQGLGRMQWANGSSHGDFNANNGSEVKASLLVPGFTTTSTSNAYGSVNVGSNSSTTISFTQHYGTALTTSNCALTNSTDFEVTGISETGVTVKFKPQSTGDKSCTLTITDANSKTCSITLTGTGTSASTATLTYHANWYTKETSGSVPAAQTVAVDATATVAGKNTLAMTNYTFSGWNTEEYITGTDYAVGSSITMDEDKDLYAKWTRSITLNQNGATTNGTTSVTGTYNCSTLPSITNPQKLGYTFVGWRTENNGTGNLVINTSGQLQSNVYHWTDQTTPSNRFQRYPTSTSPLYATWTQNITLNANTANHGLGSDGSAIATWNGSVSVGTHCTPAAGYKLEGYYTAATDGTKILNADGTFAASSITNYITSSKWTKAGATTLYAHYEPKTTVRLYYSNPVGWSTVNAYVWYFDHSSEEGGKNAKWPGVEITANTVVRSGETFYYYEYYKEDHPNWNKVIFNDGSNQTNNIAFNNTTNNGQYNDAVKDGLGSWQDLPVDETTYSVTCYAGAHGSITAKGTPIAANSSATVQVGATARPLSASPAGGYYFAGWTKTGSVAIADASSTPTTMTATGTGSVYAHWAEFYLTAPSSSRKTLHYAGKPLTISVHSALPDGCTNIVFSYEYKLSGGSWTAISPASSSVDGGDASCVWNTPSATDNKNYQVRGKVTYNFGGSSHTLYTDASTEITVVGTNKGSKTIKVKKPDEWNTFDGLHLWGSDISEIGWPGYSIQVQHLGGKWYEFVIPDVNNFILNNGIADGSSNPDKYQTVDLTYGSSITTGNCYVLDNKTDASDGKSPQKTYKYNLTRTVNCPEAPTVSASAATNITNVSATLNGRISDDGNDAITEYGFYWGTTSACANKQVKGTSFTPDNTYTHGLTGLTAGNTIYFKAFAKNGLGETVTSPATSFTVPYKVTITKPTGCSAITPGTGTQYVRVGDNIVATAATGYSFSSWSATNVTLGTPSTVTGVTTSAITALSADNGTIEPVYTPNTYTVSFDVNGGTASTPDSKEVTYDAAYGTLPSGMTHTSKQFIGWYTDPADGEGTHITAETIVSTASDHTLYAHYENVYSVNVNFKCGEASIYPSTSVEASPTSLRPTITAPEVFGYSFVNWTGSSVTFADASSATTTITATAATSVTANYAVVPTVYFKNNLGWENVYVTFDSYWKEVGGKQVPGNKDKPYYKMTQIGSSDVFYCPIPEGCVSSWKWNIAFDNTGYGYNEETHIGTYDPFYEGEFTGRGDFDQKATMFIPYNGDTETRNSGTFYKSGCWMKYNSTESGYQVKMNEYVDGAHADLSTTNLTAPTAGGYEFSAKVSLGTANYSYGFKLYKPYQENYNDLWYTNTGDITSATSSLPWAFWSGPEITADTRRCGLHTEALGDYKITVSFATGKPMVDIEYPVSVGDWKLVYKDCATWSGAAHSASWCHPSRVIKAKADAEDIVSFYVAYGSTPSIELHKCTAINSSTGAQTWTKQSDVSLTGITKKGIYNFKVSQNGSKKATVTLDGEYTGNYYIRTDASDGGWSNYKTSGKNIMTYSEYSLTHGGDFPYSHSFMRYATAGTNIKFCIANDYSECVTDTVVDDTYTGEFIAANGNVRFMWNNSTNKIGRAYLSGSTIVSDRFLVLEGDNKMFDESGNALTTAGGGKIIGLNDYEMKFTDNENWIYEATVKAQPGARIKLTAKYNDKIQYFYGAEGARSAETTELLLGGSDESLYKVRVVYDFKTNRLMRAFIPDGTITANLAINADMMIIREHQQDAHQISFSGSGALSEVKTVYGAMKFNKYTVNGKEKTDGHAETGASRFERDLFYISFPFDVKLNDVFGFGEYGKHWIIEYYDGKGRAAKGFWADSEPNWKFVMPAQRNSFTMKAFEGYILALDLDEMKESSDVWKNNVEDVYIYFPSDGNVNNIAATNRQITIDQAGYECTINRNTPDGNRTVKDSYWHCIGVPSFANYSRDLTVTGGDATIDWSDDDGVIDWTTPSLPYLYEVNWSSNTLNVTTSATFNFKATWSYLVQYAGTSIYWSQVNVTPASIVARERTAPKNAEFRIELQKDGQKADQTFVRLTEDENVTNGFDFNYDLSKEFNKNKPNIYSLVTTVKEGVASVTQSAANVQPMTEQTTVIPVGVKIAAAGDYTFAIPEGTNGVGVTLIDNETGVRTNLSALDYTINLSAGTYDERFVLEISPIMQTPTGIEQIGGDDANGARKMLIDGVLYIVKDGKIFDAQGRKMK